MVTGFAMLVAGGLLLEAGISGRSLADTIRGIATANHRLKLKLPDLPDVGGSGGTPEDFLDSVLGATGGLSGKSPKEVIDTVVIPIAKKHGWTGSARTIAASNAVHGPTSSGGRSDHQGPPDERWAGDFGTASFPDGAKGVDKFMKEVAQTFGFSTHTGLQSRTVQGAKVQLIWQAPDHYDHGHVGIQGRTAGRKKPKPRKKNKVTGTTQRPDEIVRDMF